MIRRRQEPIPLSRRGRRGFISNCLPARRLGCCAPSAMAFCIVALTVAVSGFPLARAAEHAQKLVRLAFVGPGSPFTPPNGVSAFWDRLRELGFVEGKNLAVETRWADGRLAIRDNLNKLP